MKIGVILIGVVRPSAEQVIQNIQTNIDYFTKTYPNYTFDFHVCSYKNGDSYKVEDYLNQHNIYNVFLNPIKDSDIPPEYIYPPPSQNRYRMFYSMHHVLNIIQKEKYDYIIRLRIDTMVKKFQIIDTLCDNVYYTYIDRQNGKCNDNIGYGTPKVMAHVWNIQNLHLKDQGNEEIVFKSVRKYNYTLRPFQFHYILYQSDSEYFDGIKQWSRRNREWIYDGERYIEGSNVV